MTAPPPVVELRGVSCQLGTAPPRTIVRDVSFSVAPGETLVLLGRSGSGKTTTLKLINRLIDPSAGEVVVSGRATGAVQPFRLRRGIGYVIQEVGLLPHLTVAENVGLVPRLEGWARERIDARVQELLTLVGLPPGQFAARRPHELSGGQRQRVGVARALAVDPPRLLLDEPFGARDPITRVALQGELRRIHDELGLTSLLVTHDMVEAITLADRIAVMLRGELRQLATPAELVRAPADDYVASLVAMARDQGDKLAALRSAP